MCRSHKPIFLLKETEHRKHKFKPKNSPFQEKKRKNSKKSSLPLCSICEHLASLAPGPSYYKATLLQ